MQRFFPASLLLTALALAVACEDPPPPPPPPSDAGPRDGGADAGPFSLDGGPLMDGAVTDSSVPVDAGGITCTASPSDVHELGTDTRLGERVIGLAASADRFAVAWNETRTGIPDLFARSFSEAGLQPERQLTSTTSRENAPTILAAGTNWITAWSDNEGTVGFDLRTQLLDADLADVGGRNDITTTDRLLEDVPILGRTASGPVLAWIEDNMMALSREARLVRLNEDGTMNGGIQNASESGRSPGRLAVAELSPGPAILWAERAMSGQEVWLQPLTAAGARSGAPLEVTVGANGDGTVDAALDPAGGAVVFGVQVSGVRNEVRFRPVTGDGVLAGAERVLTPMGGRDPSIAYFAGGYAVSYRDTSVSPARIVLLLVSALGEVLDELAITDAASGGGRTTVRVSGEGNIGIAWADDPGGEVRIRAALVRCGS